MNLMKLRNQDGAIDLASIMVGVVVTGVVASAISSTVFAAIPWAQNEAAKSSLQAVSMAQSVAHVQTGQYSTISELVTDGYLPKGAESLGASGPALPAAGKGFAVKAATPAGESKLIVDVGENASCFAAVIESEAGKVFWLDNANPKPRAYDKKTSASLCSNLSDLVEELPSSPKGSQMHLTIDTSLAGCQSFTLPISSLVYGPVTVNWGDGSLTQPGIGVNPKHEYASADSYKVVIDGGFGFFGHHSTTTMDTECITAVTRWDEGTKTTRLSYAFFNSPVTTVATPPSTVTDMSYMFSGATAFNGKVPFDTSKVTDMSSMFQGAKAFNQPVNFDTSEVAAMTNMFSGATIFDQPVDFDTSQVINMTGMFRSAEQFDQSLSSFKTDKVTGMNNMFHGAKRFNQSVSHFNTSATTSMSFMFSGATLFDQPVSNFDTKNVTRFEHMFASTDEFDRPVLNFDTSKAIDMQNMFNGAKKFNQPLAHFDTSGLYSSGMTGMFRNAALFSQDLKGWVVTNVATAPTLFSTGSALTAGQLPLWGK